MVLNIQMPSLKRILTGGVGNRREIDDDFVFCIIGGCPRSGTTALLDSLNASDRVGLMPEVNFFKLIDHFDALYFKETKTKSKLWIRNINANERPNARVLLDDFLEYIPSLEREQRAFIKSFFSIHFSEKKLSVIGEKLPIYYTLDHAALENRVGPIKYIHIVRHPLYVLNSFMHRRKLTEDGKDLWKYPNPGDAIMMWINAWNYMVSNHLQNPENFLPVKYEGFFDSRDQYEQIAHYLGIDHAVLRPFVGEQYPPLNSIDDHAQGLYDKLLPEFHGSWDRPLETLMKEIGPITQEAVNQRLEL